MNSQAICAQLVELLLGFRFSFCRTASGGFRKLAKTMQCKQTWPESQFLAFLQNNGACFEAGSVKQLQIIRPTQTRMVRTCPCHRGLADILGVTIQDVAPPRTFAQIRDEAARGWVDSFKQHSLREAFIATRVERFGTTNRGAVLL